MVTVGHNVYFAVGNVNRKFRWGCTRCRCILRMNFLFNVPLAVRAYADRFGGEIQGDERRIFARNSATLSAPGNWLFFSRSWCLPLRKGDDRIFRRQFLRIEESQDNCWRQWKTRGDYSRWMRHWWCETGEVDTGSSMPSAGNKSVDGGFYASIQNNWRQNARFACLGVHSSIALPALTTIAAPAHVNMIMENNLDHSICKVCRATQ